jgi:hypothetical protein
MSEPLCVSGEIARTPAHLTRPATCFRERNGSEGICAQLDFSATPKDNKGQYFQYIICDSPLGEAVDAGIVKTPVIGRCSQLTERLSENAAERYQQHLLLGYEPVLAPPAPFRYHSLDEALMIRSSRASGF